MIKRLLLFVCLLVTAATNGYAAIESFIIKQPKGEKEYVATCYSQSEPWVIAFEKKVKESDIVFLKDLEKPIWITFKHGDVSMIIHGENKRIKGTDISGELRWQIIRFRDALDSE
jgi:hypothetical protein